MSNMIAPYRYAAPATDPSFSSTLSYCCRVTARRLDHVHRREFCGSRQCNLHRFRVVDTSLKKFGTGSIRFSGSTGSVQFADHADWTLGAGDFTIEMWASFDTTWIESTSSLISHYSTTSNQRGWDCQYRGGDATNNLSFVASSTGTSASFIVQGNWTPTADTFYHVVFERSGTTFRIYVGGTMLAKATNSLTIFDSTSALNLGNAGSGGEALKGNLDEVRVTIGVARYNSDGGYTCRLPRSRGATQRQRRIGSSNHDPGPISRIDQQDQNAALSAAKVRNSTTNSSLARRLSGFRRPSFQR
jgi:hypothetical protein